MLNDPQFWVFVAFVIFITAIFKPLKKILIVNLDKKINEIKNSINKAEEIKNEAQKNLSEILDKYKLPTGIKLTVDVDPISFN